METNYPSEWIERYAANNYLAVDPVALEGRRTPLPFRWREALSRPGYGPAARRVFAEAAVFGLNDGLSIPIHGGAGLSLMSLAVDDPALFAGRAGAAARHVLHLMALHYHLACERDRTALPPPPVRLTGRESEVLMWAAQGKTGWEIAQILTVSERTVTYHMENAKAKLGASGRSHAVAKALALGLISP